jgi:hypothetical protein
MKRAVVAWMGWLALASWSCSDDGAANDAPQVSARDAMPSPSSTDDRRERVGDDQAATDREERASESVSAEANPVEASETGSSDVALIAESNGWTLEETRLYLAKSDAAGEVAARLDAERTEVFVGSAVGPEPSDAPRMYIKGAADARVYEIVGAAQFEIRVIDQQPYSRVEIDTRQSRLVEELLRLGFLNFSVGTDIQREGLMEGMAQRIAGAPESADAVLAALPAPLRERTSITLVDDPVAIFQ